MEAEEYEEEYGASGPGYQPSCSRAGNAEQEDVTKMSILMVRQPCGRRNALQQTGWQMGEGCCKPRDPPLLCTRKLKYP